MSRGHDAAPPGPEPAPGYRLAVPIEVRFRDIDGMNHVNNAVYFTYFENARIAYWKAVPRIRSRRALDYVLAHAACDFLAPLTLEHAPICDIRVASFGRASFVFEYLVRDAATGTEVARGSTVQVMYDYERREVKPLDDELKEAIREFEGRHIEERAGRGGPGARRTT